MLEFIRRLFSRQRARVVCDPLGLSFTTHTGAVQSVAWADLEQVMIVTTNEGPWVDDVAWILRTSGGDCVVPSEAEGVSTLLHHLQELRGFDDEAVIQAMGCTDNKHFVVWRSGRAAS